MFGCVLVHVIFPPTNMYIFLCGKYGNCNQVIRQICEINLKEWMNFRFISEFNSLGQKASENIIYFLPKKKL